MKIGQAAVKTAGRDSNRLCVVVDVLEGSYVLIDGNVRRKKCNILHLEPIDKILKIKKKASHTEVIEAMKKAGLKIIEKEKKKEKREKKEKPKKKRKVKEESKEVKRKTR